MELVEQTGGAKEMDLFPVSGTASLTMQIKQSQSMALYHRDLTTQSGK